MHIEPEMFTSENGKLTPSVKICRPYLDRFYRTIVDSLVEEAALFKRESFNSQERTKALVAQALGGTVDNNASFKAVGGDSLAAIRLINLIKEEMNVDIPIGNNFFIKRNKLCNRTTL